MTPQKDNVVEGRLEGFSCETPGHESEPCNDHGGWHDFGDMAETITEHIRAGCDIVLIVDTSAKGPKVACSECQEKDQGGGGS